MSRWRLSKIKRFHFASQTITVRKSESQVLARMGENRNLHLLLLGMQTGAFILENPDIKTK